MGIIYKLSPKIKGYILEKKQAEPNLSCRKLASLVSEKFQTKLSKSSINSLFKASGLSMPVGRRRKKSRRSLSLEGLGAILLKAADYLLGGTYYITEAIKNRLNIRTADLLAKTETLLYQPLFNTPLPSAVPGLDSGLWLLVNQKFEPKEISSYLKELQEVTALTADIIRVFPPLFPEVRCIKVVLPEGTSFYLDGQLHTVWSTAHIPYDFATTSYNIKSYINNYLQQDTSLVLFTAPGYDIPTKEFFEFIANLTSREKGISKLVLLGNKFEEKEVIPLSAKKEYSLVFGFWPWQFGKYRSIKFLGDFKQFHFWALKQDFHLSAVEVELSQPNVNKRVTLRGCALKSGLNEKVRLIILSNIPPEKLTSEGLANIYLNRWPNLEETFQDFSRKIELLTYTASSQRFFAPENLSLSSATTSDINLIFDYYLKVLDAYVRWHFLPLGYEDTDFPTVKERFYNLGGRLTKQAGQLVLTFIPPSGYQFFKELEYVCRRINEKVIILGEKRLWLSL